MAIFELPDLHSRSVILLQYYDLEKSASNNLEPFKINGQAEKRKVDLRVIIEVISLSNANMIFKPNIFTQSIFQ